MNKLQKLEKILNNTLPIYSLVQLKIDKYLWHKSDGLSYKIICYYNNAEYDNFSISCENAERLIK